METEPEVPIPSVDAFFAERGPAARAISGFRPRKQQLAMAHAVARAIRDRRHLVVEAGTGVGKSFGYLVPAVLEAVAEGRRVVVSTQTIALQQQLVDKDVPRLLEALEELDVDVVVAKGRSNYLAPRRLQAALERAESFRGGEGLAEELRRLGREIRRTSTGTRQEVHPAPWGEAWDQARSERNDCLGKRCPHFEDDCWFHRARRRVHLADVVIVNHSLYFADLALREEGTRLLPEHDVVVFDEAHGLEAVALDHFGARVARTEVMHLLSRLHRPSRRQGLLQILPRSENARAAVAQAAMAAERFFGEAAIVCGREFERELTREGELPDLLGEPLRALAAELEALARDGDDDARASELGFFSKRMREIAATLGETLALDPETRVHWVRRGQGLGDVELRAQPLEVGALLRERLFDRVGTAVLTSATLSVGQVGGLDWISGRLGVPDARKLRLGSPFDHAARVRLRVPTWLDEPRDDEDYVERAGRAILDYVERSQGGAFVLFTSYGFMNRIRDAVAPRLEALGFPLLVQGGDLSRQHMLDRFREHDDAVLFGADSFWQGVDVAGDRLRLVVITRLPFPVPSHPLQRARARMIERRGGNAFRELSLPEAVMRFKQGFGRLVRSEDDKGTVVVLDTRIVTRRYGRAFLDALPEVPLIQD